MFRRENPRELFDPISGDVFRVPDSASLDYYIKKGFKRYPKMYNYDDPSGEAEFFFDPWDVGMTDEEYEALISEFEDKCMTHTIKYPPGQKPYLAERPKVTKEEIIAFKEQTKADYEAKVAALEEPKPKAKPKAKTTKKPRKKKDES